MDSFYTPLRDEFIRFAGGDALAFLEAMTTNDLSAMAQPGHTRLTGFCSPQGRLLGLMQLSGEGETFYARVPEGMAEPLIEQFKPFVFRSKVEMTPVGERWCVVGAAGPDLNNILRGADVPIPAGPGQTAGRDGLHVMCLRDQVIEMALPVQGLPELSDALAAAQLCAAETSDWEQLAIADGIPEIYPATMDEFIPQMVDLDKLGGVSFEKGCYPGQEIIARIRSRGSVKRHMHQAHADTVAAPAPGTGITDQAGKPAGTVVRSTAIQEQAVMLAVINDSAAETDLSLPGNAALTVLRRRCRNFSPSKDGLSQDDNTSTR